MSAKTVLLFCLQAFLAHVSNFHYLVFVSLPLSRKYASEVRFLIGELPFLGTVGLEGALPTAGAGAVSYGCGNGAVGMVSEDIAAPAWGYPAAAGLGYGPGLAAGIGYGPAIAGRAFGGCGCGIY
ncbi:Chorion class B protein Ld34 [Papilio machaon]|uniref:Chorion class B protein Ld34 n=1 Tax=Papilio machaon TaxID=76193 RepID=A0A194R4Y1_PAPMA|nr:Chorion class B protein Ld34 [Papilio machaon]